MHTASACFASFLALHLLSAACFGTRVANKLTSLMHSLGATVQATLFLLSAEAVALQSDLYGESAAVAQLFAFSLGFFLYDVLYEAVWVPVVQKAASEPGFVVHGVACSACYYFGLRPFLHHMGSIMLLNEASTVLLNARALLLLSGRDSGRLFAAVQTTFGLTFIGVRLVVAIPASLSEMPEASQDLCVRVLATLEPAHRRVFTEVLLEKLPDTKQRLRAFDAVEMLLAGVLRVPSSFIKHCCQHMVSEKLHRGINVYSGRVPK